jgi:hypothetical protein
MSIRGFFHSGSKPVAAPPPGGLPTDALMAYYEADTGITLSGSDVVGWDDLSGNGYHMGAPATPPTMGGDEVVFDLLTAQYLENATPVLVQPFVIYVVGYMDANFGYPTFYRESSLSASMGVTNTSPTYAYIQKGAYLEGTDGSVAHDQHQVYRGIFDNASSSIQVSAGTPTSGTIGSSASCTGIVMGIQNYTPGVIMRMKAMYVYSGEIPSDSDVKAYILDRWGI